MHSQNLRKRSYTAEMMDELEMGGDEMAKTLDELEIINKLLGGYSVVTDALQNHFNKYFGTNKKFTLADLGCGGGDTLRVIAKWARRKNLNLEMTGFDANHFIIQYATKKSKHFPEVSYMQADVFSEEFAALKFDIVTASLFTHHFTDEQLVKLFKQIKTQARELVIINDLHRHPFAYYSIKYLTKFLAKSPLIKNDAPLSVARAFTRKELQQILKEAGIYNYKIKWRWAFRWQITFGNML